MICNHKITMTDIPLEAYEYMVNGKPALEWVMERQGVRTDKDSGIVNDANLYAKETVNSAAYPLDSISTYNHGESRNHKNSEITTETGSIQGYQQVVFETSDLEKYPITALSKNFKKLKHYLSFCFQIQQAEQ